jgi:hypothetical protein
MDARRDARRKNKRLKRRRTVQTVRGRMTTVATTMMMMRKSMILSLGRRMRAGKAWGNAWGRNRRRLQILHC